MTSTSRESPEKIFSYCSVVKPVTFSDRPMSVNDTAMSISTGTMKKRMMRAIAGPRKMTKLARCRATDRALPRRSMPACAIAAMIVRRGTGASRRGARPSVFKAIGR